MADFNKVLSPGDFDSGLINTVVEISQGSRLKIEWDRERAAMMLDRIEPEIFAKPCNYGFIPGTLDEDGDELDTLIVCSEPLPTGIWLEARIVGIMNFIDDGEADHKVIVVPADDRDNGDSINSLDDLGQRWVDKITHHFTHYKDLKKPGITSVKGFDGSEEAKRIIAECIERYSAA